MQTRSMSELAQSSSVTFAGGPERLMNWALSAPADELTLELLEGDDAKPVSLRCFEVLRVLPGRRVVCRGWLGEVPVVIKWFVGAGAERYQRREFAGCQTLAQAKVPTPKILRAYNFAANSGQSGGALVFEYLADAQELTDQQLDTRPELFKELWRLLARMNETGVVHHDLHFGNLMCRDESLWLIDGDAVTRPRQTPLGVQDSAQMFVRLAAQTQTSLTADRLVAHWSDYCAGRQFESSAVAQAPLLRRYRRARRDRIQHFQAKTQRNCSAFARRRTILGEALLDRTWLQTRHAQPELDEAQIGRDVLAWLDDLPQLMSGRDEFSGEWLKRGNTATVVAASYRGEPLIVKRYNNKSFWHRLRRMLIRDRGLNSWVYAHTLAFTGIATSEAVALLRTRFGGPTYLVMRLVKGAELAPEQFENTAHQDTFGAFERVSQKLLQLLNQLSVEGFVHGDTKASNFLWDSDSEDLTIIDLDSMRMPALSRTIRSGHERDRRRLLRKFASAPDLQRRLGSLLDSSASKTRD